MSLDCGILECVFCLGCSRWAWKRCIYAGAYDSEQWPLANIEEFEPVPRICRNILAVYEDDLKNPKWAPAGGYGMNPDWVAKKVTYETTKGRVPPYLIYIDHDAHDIVLAIRGLNLAKESDYAVLLDNKLGKKMFDGGYVHDGLLKSASWLISAESETLKDLIKKNPSYTLTFAGHSLGSGVAAMLTLVVANNREEMGNIPRSKIRCYAIAPARCMSLNLAVRYADIINSVILQDDFLARTATPLEDIFESIFCLPCLLCIRCMKDTFTSEEKKLKDPRRLYAPGRLYHIVDRKPCGCGRYPPEVKNAIPVEGRFEHIILSLNTTSDHAIIWIEREARKALQDDFLPRTATPLEDIFKSLFCLPCLLCVRCMKDTFMSEERKLNDPRRLYAPGRLYHIVDRKPCGCGRYPPEVKSAVPVEGRFEHIILSLNTTSDHGIIWIEREAQKALNLMMEKGHYMEIPSEQRMERQETIAKEHDKEHKNALERAHTLNIPHAFPPSYDTFDENESSAQEALLNEPKNSLLDTEVGESSANKRTIEKKTDWEELINKLFTKNASGKVVLKKGVNTE